MMGGMTPAEMEKLILGYEDLEPGDQELADAYLRSHPELARRLKWHQDKEKTARSEIPTMDEPRDGDLSPQEIHQQKESLRRILSALDEVGRAGADQPGKVRELSSAFRRPATWVLPLAAALALIFLVPRGGQQKILLTDLSVAEIDLMADGSRGRATTMAGGGTLQTGQAFALDFTLQEDAFVVVYHMDPAGRVTRVFPEAVTEDLPRHRGGRGHQIPDPTSGETWILGSETGTETFLLGISRQMPTLQDQLGKTSSGLDRTLALDRLKTSLENVFDQVEIFEFEHQD